MKRHFTAAVTALCVCGTAAFADIYTESGDAGQTVGTAQNVTGVANLTRIEGSLMPDGNDVDIFRIVINDFANFRADTFGTRAGGFPNPDTQLFLFDENGFGVYGNDDAPGGGTVDSELISGVVSSNGTYLLAITTFNNEPISAGGAIFDPTGAPFTATVTPTGPGGGSALTGWDSNGDSGEHGAYGINLEGATVIPAPGAVLLAAFGLPIVGIAKRRRS